MWNITDALDTAHIHTHTQRKITYPTLWMKVRKITSTEFNWSERFRSSYVLIVLKLRIAL